MVAFVFIFSLITSFLHLTAQQCSTPNGTEGDCIDVKNCAAIVSALRAPFLTPQTIRYLRRSQCGFSGTTPRVCCAGSDAPRPFRLPIRPRSKPKPVDLGSRFGDDILPSLNECGEQLYGDRIFDGMVTSIDEFPWMALLEYSTKHGRGFACGGVLISKRYVLTAAHCVTGPAISTLGNVVGVRLGEHDLRNEIDCDADWADEVCALPPVNVAVESVHPHPNYEARSSNRQHDIALIRLAEPVTFTDFIQPICLPSQQTHASLTSAGDLMYIAGWGQTEKGSASSVKLKAKVPVVPRSDCILPYAQKGIIIADTQMCAGGSKQDSCKGDSGGPLMAVDSTNPTEERWFAAGIVSFGAKPCASLGVPAVYTVTAKYMEWIRATVKL